jgi:TolB protein
MSISRLAAGVAALALAVAGGATSAALAVHGSGPRAEALLGANQVTTGDHVPWDRVGAGWYLALVDEGPQGEFGINARHQMLDLVNPLGGRYQMVKTTVGSNGSGFRQLADWSADGRRALVLVGPGSAHPRAVTYDLEAGTHRVVELGGHTASVAFGPSGSLYVTRYGTRYGAAVLRRDPDGSAHVVVRRTAGQVLASLQGRRIVVAPYASRNHHLEVVASDGRVLASLAVPAKCAPVRWQDARTVLASCYNPSNGATRLFAVPVDGSAVTAVSARHGAGSADLGDLDARRLDGTTFLEAAGPCGVVFLARQHPDGTATEVRVPGSTGNVYLLGTRDHELVLQTGVSCDGGGSRAAITHFDPRTHVDRVIALLPKDEEYQTIRAWQEPRATDG